MQDRWVLFDKEVFWCLMAWGQIFLLCSIATPNFLAFLTHKQASEGVYWQDYQVHFEVFLKLSLEGGWMDKYEDSLAFNKSKIEINARHENAFCGLRCSSHASSSSFHAFVNLFREKKHGVWSSEWKDYQIQHQLAITEAIVQLTRKKNVWNHWWSLLKM